MRRPLVAWCLLPAAILFAGCTEEPDDSGDAIPDASPDGDVGGDVAGDADGSEVPDGWSPDPPAEPAAPVLTPCPAGWREVAGEPTVCDPWPEETAPPACADDEARFPGETDCARVGTACGTDDWAEDLPVAEVVAYVLAGAAAVGDGSRGAPFATIAEGVAAATSGGVVAVGRGTYDEAVVLPAGVVLWGACTAETVVACSVPSTTQGVITAAGPATGVRNLRIEGARSGVFSLGALQTVDLQDVVILRAEGHGLAVDGRGGATGRNVVIREIDGLGRGVAVQGGGDVALGRLVVAANGDTGIYVAGDGSEATLEDVVVRDTSTSTAGEGLWVQRGARAVVTRGVFERNRNVGVAVLHAGSSASLTDVVIRGTLERLSDGTGGAGLIVEEGATVEVSRAFFSGNRDATVVVRGAGTTATLGDVVIRDTQPRVSDERGGEGIGIENGAVVTLARAALSGGREIGIVVQAWDSVLRAEDLVVEDTRSRLFDLRRGGGLFLLGGASVDVRRGRFEGNREVAILAASPETVATLSDVVVRGTLPQECVETTCAGGELGVGVGVLGGANVELTRFVVAANSMCGLVLAYGRDPAYWPYPEGGTADLHEGEVSGHPIGVNVQTEGFDMGRLMDRVLYRDNERDLDSDALPTPDTSVD